ncbi:TetR/AcrR family transcriptional regulator [Candidatus Entotheonella palauensis]|nr:TetR/AcrR family transcriptional regulator [Candidatus Entotheonella palauensis]
MANTARKQREWQQREDLILGVARQMLLEGGYLGLNMDRIAEALEYSKGTIYQHFSCKEEVLSAICTQSLAQMADLFAQGNTFSGRTRERMMAIGEAYDLFVKFYPHHFQSSQILRTVSIREKTSEARQQRFEAVEHRCIGIVSGIIRDGLAQGDLVLPMWISPEQFTFGLWALSSGAHAIMAGKPLENLGIERPYDTLYANYHIMLDGVGWQPLSHVWDYEQTRARIRQEVFRDAYRQLELA